MYYKEKIVHINVDNSTQHSDNKHVDLTVCVLITLFPYHGIIIQSHEYHIVSKIYTPDRLFERDTFSLNDRQKKAWCLEKTTRPD